MSKTLTKEELKDNFEKQLTEIKTRIDKLQEEINNLVLTKEQVRGALFAISLLDAKIDEPVAPPAPEAPAEEKKAE